MSESNNTQESIEKYPVAMRVLHWLVGLSIMALLAVGFYMANLDPDAPDKYALYPVHKATGIIVLFLVLIRLPIRLKGPVPEPVTTLEQWEKTLSHWVHIGLYVAMLSMTWSGYIMSSAYPKGKGIDMYGLFTMPDIVGKSEEVSSFFSSIHEITAWAFVILLALHIGGALKHRFIDSKDKDVLPRMM